MLIEGIRMYKYKHRQSELHSYIRDSQGNEEMIAKSIMCACFNCGKRFFSRDIHDWAICEGSNSKTAICPLCDTDSVIVDDGRGYIDKELLDEIKRYYKQQIEFTRVHK